MKYDFVEIFKILAGLERLNRRHVHNFNIQHRKTKIEEIHTIQIKLRTIKWLNST